MTATEFRGIAVRYESWGAGPPLVMLHAGGGSGGQWHRVASSLQGRHRIIAPDLIGFGRTEAWPRSGELTHDLQAELVAALIEEEGGGAVDVVGHSYGGAVAVRLASATIAGAAHMSPLAHPEELARIISDHLGR